VDYFPNKGFEFGCWKVEEPLKSVPLVEELSVLPNVGVVVVVIAGELVVADDIEPNAGTLAMLALNVAIVEVNGFAKEELVAEA